MRVPEMTIRAKGQAIILRTATEQDAQMLIDYLKKTCAETRFLAKEPEEIQMTVEQEEQFIKRTNDSQTDLMLLAFLNGTYIGNCSFTGVSTSRYRAPRNDGNCTLPEIHRHGNRTCHDRKTSGDCKGKRIRTDGTGSSC